ncbi:MAG: hypothetical protein KatS3mg132_680 [Limisphaera sp.]|nr:MAG: hypothetical protein KatS3mg132_680 [Limisphaera sp.]
MVRSQPDRVQSEIRSAFVAQTPELLIHDLDGNLVRDGRWMYSWDAENRLTRVITVAGPSSSFRQVEWKYDALGRRVRQTSYVLSNGVWQVVEDLNFVSDPELFGRHVAELNATNNAPVRAYIWGVDLSETLDGAGGVGGLLWVRMATGPASGTHFVCYDGNGNVWNLVSASTGTETARYEYGPFGEPLRLSGPAARTNPFRLSTKRTEEFTGLVPYEYRAYSPASGRWLSRDPSALGGNLTAFTVPERQLQLYAFCRGSPTVAVDRLGLAVSVAWSLGFAFRGPLYASVGSRLFSGWLPVTDAFYYEWASPLGRSICNSGRFLGPTDEGSSSFVEAWIKPLCPGRVFLSCKAVAGVRVWGALSRRMFWAPGHVLGVPMSKSETTTYSTGEGAYVSLFHKEVSQELRLVRVYHFYRIMLPVAFQVEPFFQGGFEEWATVSCRAD